MEHDNFWQKQAEKAQELNYKYARLHGQLHSILTFETDYIKTPPKERVKQAIRALEEFDKEIK